MSQPFFLILPFVSQGLLMMIDEFYYHEKRGLGLWERVGHPLDTLTVLLPVGFALLNDPSQNPNPMIYISLAVFSCLFVTKDEWVHTRECGAGENALHALLFILHPVILWSGFQLWLQPNLKQTLLLQFAIIFSFGLYQLLRWRPWLFEKSFLKPSPNAANAINTQVYDTLGDRWYTAKDDPIALLRAETRARIPWITQELSSFNQGEVRKLLDLGCGAGLLTNALAKRLNASQWVLAGVDFSAPSLETAQKHAPSPQEHCTVHYTQGDARKLPFENGSFDAVCAMDFLEHVENPSEILTEISRILKPGGLFFFHTFTRTALSRFLVIDLVEAFIPNTPRNLHVDHLFIKPDELRQMCESNTFQWSALHALNPVITPSALASLLFKREIPDSFRFKIEDKSRIRAGYIGTARRL
jgi:2-polyprenyl-6-hydroxyphenyl methylase/3-demethylubiquinone-9 3-methyltransferase